MVVRRIIGLCLILVLARQLWTHRNIAILSTKVRSQEGSGDTLTEPDASQTVTVAGPLAELLKTETAGNHEEEQPASQRTVASDHVGPSPVGTNAVLLHRTFWVARAVEQPFDLPPHAFNPQLHGSYVGFSQGSQEIADEPGSVQFLLLNEEQHTNFIGGRPAEALLTADGSHEQEINFRMPPTFEQSARYYMVFKNSSRSRKQVVRADFRIEY
jgi:hypothetical protein